MSFGVGIWIRARTQRAKKMGTFDMWPFRKTQEKNKVDRREQLTNIIRFASSEIPGYEAVLVKWRAELSVLRPYVYHNTQPEFLPVILRAAVLTGDIADYEDRINRHKKWIEDSSKELAEMDKPPTTEVTVTSADGYTTYSAETKAGENI